jgi:hypothetical protein
MSKTKFLSYLLLSLFLLLTMYALFSCRTAKSVASNSASNTTEQKGDSLIYIERMHIDTVKVAAESASLTIPFKLLKDSLINYMEKSNGRAQVIIQRKGDSILVQANCDSLMQLLISRDKELRKWQQYALDHKETKTTTTVYVKPPTWFVWLLIIAALLAALSIAVQIFKIKIPFLK